MGGIAVGAVLERVLFRRFYQREHLDQVLLTFALILLFEEGRSLLAGNDFHSVAVPASLDCRCRWPPASPTPPTGWRCWPRACWWRRRCSSLIERTRVGSAIRAAAEKPEMVDLLGLDASRIHMLVFAAGTALAMLAGALAAPLQSVYPNMGDGFLIVSFVVVVVGGVGSVAGAFWGALLIGVVDTMAKAYLPVGSGLAIYVIMAAVLLWRPTGLFARA